MTVCVINSRNSEVLSVPSPGDLGLLGVCSRDGGRGGEYWSLGGRLAFRTVELRVLAPPTYLIKGIVLVYLYFDYIRRFLVYLVELLISILNELKSLWEWE